MSTIKYWIWLATLPGLSRRAFRLLLEYFQNPMEAYFAAFGEYDRIEGLTEKDRSLLARKELDRAEGILEACAGKNIRIMTMQDADYPQRLTHIYDPPPVLYVRGRMPVIDEESAIAVVGTRKASAYGIKMALRLGYELTKGGGLVVSGLAAGVDAAAAKGALNAGGSCVGVLGSAIDVNYPPQNAGLIEDVAQAGAVLSEYPPGYPTLGANFPRRNRILSGLSVGVVVIEAPKRSGALITANLALEQGRELFAVPGNADAPNCAGSNELLRDCAKAVTNGRDVLCEFEHLFPRRIPAVTQPSRRLPGRPEGRPTGLTGDGEGPAEGWESASEIPPAEPHGRGKNTVLKQPEKRQTTKKVIDKKNNREYIDLEGLSKCLSETQISLISAMKRPGMHADEIIELTGLPAATVLAELTMLSVMGLISQGRDRRYTLNTMKRGK